MDDTLFLLVIVLGTFITVPLVVLAYREIRLFLFRSGALRHRTIRTGNRAALEAYLFIETNIGLKLDLFQVLMSMISCACFVVAT